MVDDWMWAYFREVTGLKEGDHLMTEGDDRAAERWVERTVHWMRQQIVGAGCAGTVVGLSGGLDSAVVAALGARADLESSLAVFMGCESLDEDRELAILVADTLGVQFMEITLDEVYRTLVAELPRGDGEEERRAVSLANIKPRLRMTVLYYMAQLRNLLVVGTGNRNELHLGYFTKYGDGGSDLLPLGRLVKSQVVRTARYLKIPDEIIERPPSAGLWPGQTDEKELGLSYDDIDAYLLEGEAPAEVRERIDRIHRRTAHKRSTPPIPPFPFQ